MADHWADLQGSQPIPPRLAVYALQAHVAAGMIKQIGFQAGMPSVVMHAAGAQQHIGKAAKVASVHSRHITFQQGGYEAKEAYFDILWLPALSSKHADASLTVQRIVHGT